MTPGGSAVMLDNFTIFSLGGLILWRYERHPIIGGPLEALVCEILAESRAGEDQFLYTPPTSVGSKYIIRWTVDNVSSSNIVGSGGVMVG